MKNKKEIKEIRVVEEELVAGTNWLGISVFLGGMIFFDEDEVD